MATVPLPETWQRLFAIYLPIVVFDCGSELMLVIFHDLPLCRGEFEEGPNDKKKEYKKWIIIALIGQILTAMSWTSIFGFVCYYAVFSRCPTGDPQAFSTCKQLIPGATEAIVIFIVLLKNSMTLKEYKERVYVYPIICNEQMLYLHHITLEEEEKIHHSFAKFNSLSLDEDIKEESEGGCSAFFESTPFLIATNYLMLMFFDVASLASVSNLIVVHGATIVQTGLRAFPFVVILVVDILSESLILYYHDLPLTRGETEHPKTNQKIFDISRMMHVFVNFAWLGSLLYMIYEVINVQCVAECDCYETCIRPFDCTARNRTQEVCYESMNITGVGIPFNEDPKYDYNCSVSWSVADCRQSSPSYNSCILLGLVLLDSFYQMGQMFFRSYIYPITVPESVMFLAYWKKDKDLIINAIGRNEFGPEYDFARGRSKPLLPKDGDQVELEQ